MDPPTLNHRDTSPFLGFEAVLVVVVCEVRPCSDECLKLRPIRSSSSLTLISFPANDAFGSPARRIER
jgi:hypothetical protein